MKPPNTAFSSSGYRIHVNSLSRDRCRELRELLIQFSGTEILLASGSAFKWSLPASAKCSELQEHLLFDPTILNAVRQNLGVDDVRFAWEFNAKIWQGQRATGWHRDGLKQDLESGVGEWDESLALYKVVRVAIYLPEDDGVFWWGCLPGTHREETKLDPETAASLAAMPAPQHEIGSRIPGMESSRGRLPLGGASGVLEPEWIPVRAGDVLVFDPRLIHAGGPVTRRKFAYFFSFGMRNSHTRSYSQLRAPTEVEVAFSGKLRARGLHLDY